ncbi:MULTISPECIES: CRTAC1 family protein [Halocynthiibacter]|uniref:CRTAC1 family protein n=1 Tax=Halocynthiibacter halioticoli TaxID=2986804 RepID=A0AAE3LRA7_9RHOB|nr:MULTISPECIES: CRTAC1 family protein [Halocynthiibacter]MCV6825372.1 CRTAC1 family protein [Halocynthiibacter halioticoli]MCW4058373.1 CRTAC1 family protein [Halocynthiibacter sp. SDUM655004]
MRCSTALLTTLLATPIFANPSFEPISIEAHEYIGGWEFYVGGGLASFDCNDDDLPELYAAGGEAPAALFVNTSTKAALDFRKETPEALAIQGMTGAYPIDIDSDGITDLAILSVGENMLLKGEGNCTFRPFDALEFSSSSHWTTSFSATWEANNSLPTLAFGNYVDREDPNGPFETCDVNTLYRPNGKSYATPFELSPGYCTLSMLFSDWGRNGRADLRVSNDRHYYVKGGEEQMWAMEETPRLYTQEDGWESFSIWGMGIASRDLTGDGLAEIALTSMGDQKIQSPIDRSAPRFTDYTFERGTTAHRPYTGGDGRPSTGWHVAFGDIQNNGRDDIFIAKGNVERMPGAAMKDPNNLLIQGEDGNFTEFGDVAGIASLVRSRGAVLADLNNDGLLDLAVNNRKAPLEVYQNTSTETGNWLAVQLSQNSTNTDAIGSVIEVKTQSGIQTREVTIGGGHAGGSLAAQHFGLGDHTDGELRVIWPDGTEGAWQAFKAGQKITVRNDT